jgi:hypothetical protein
MNRVGHDHELLRRGFTAGIESETMDASILGRRNKTQSKDSSSGSPWFDPKSPKKQAFPSADPAIAGECRHGIGTYDLRPGAPEGTRNPNPTLSSDSN